MTPTLQITIPTFNRLEKLKAMLGDLSQIGDCVRSGRLRIAVFDNSDSDQVEYLGAEISDLIEYTWNGGNLGFHGNIRKCLLNGEADFLWLIADDDILKVSEIPKIIDYLEKHSEKIMGLALPYEVRYLPDAKSYNEISVTPNFGIIASFGEIVLTGRIPFDFLASFIIKSDSLSRIDFANIISQNDYYHSLIYCSCLRQDDLIGIYDDAILSYVAPDTLNWSLRSLVDSKNEICDLLINEHQIQMNKSAILSEILKWAIFGRIGTTDIRNLENDIGPLVRFALRDRSARNLLLAVLLIAPSVVAREVAIFALAISASKNSPQHLLQSLRNMRRIVNSKARARKPR